MQQCEKKKSKINVNTTQQSLNCTEW